MTLPVAAAIQAVLYGLGHIHPRSGVAENGLVVAVATVNAVWLTAVMMMAASDDGSSSLWLSLIPCIVAHFLYDMHVLAQTWHSVNAQLDWIEENNSNMWNNDNDNDSTSRQRRQQQQVSPDNTTLAICRRFFYAFDSQHCHSLSETDVQRAVEFAFLNPNSTAAFVHHHHSPTTQQIKEQFYALCKNNSDDSRDGCCRIELAEFVQLLSTLRKQALKEARLQLERRPSNTTPAKQDINETFLQNLI